MIYLSTRELYSLFLQSDFWIGLSRQKRRQAGRCERCGSRQRLQSHHRLYRASWFDTQLSDLECLCRGCHAKEHGLTLRPLPKVEPVLNITSLPELMRARSARLITRAEFHRLKQKLSAFPLPCQRLKKHKRSKRGKPAKKPTLARVYYYQPPRRKWTSQRGTSSN